MKQGISDAEMRKRIGTALRSQRKSCRLTQSEVARAIRASVSAVCKWERGQASMPATKLMALSHMLRINLESLQVQISMRAARREV